jgi:hypothetical protein
MNEYKASTSPDVDDLIRSINGWESDGFVLVTITQSWNAKAGEMSYTAWMRRSR